MMKELRHLPHYLVLVGILGLGFWGFTGFSYDKAFQTAVTVAVSISFLIWGIVHHLVHEDLCLKVILEYLAMAILGAVVLIVLIWSP